MGKLFAISNVDSRMERRSSGSDGAEGKRDAACSSQVQGLRPTSPAHSNPTLPNGGSSSTVCKTNNAHGLGRNSVAAESLSDLEWDDHYQQQTKPTEKTAFDASVPKQLPESNARAKLLPQTLKLKVLMLKSTFIIAAEDNKGQIRIDKDLCPTDYPLRRGDWLKVQLEPSSDRVPRELPDISQVDWLERNESTNGIVTQTADGPLCINQRIYFFYDDVKGSRPLKMGDKVRFISAASDRWSENMLERRGRSETGGQSTSFRYKSRALAVILLDNTSSSPNKAAQELYRHMDEKIEKLLARKNMIKITPSRELDLGSVVLGSSASGEMTIENNGRDDIILKDVRFWNTQRVCEFEAVFRSADEPAGYIIPSGEVRIIKIECQTIELGRTREMCVFDFGSDVRIGRYILANSTTEVNY